MDATNISAAELQAYAEQLRHFTNQVSRYCDALEKGASHYARYMRDENSQSLCKNSCQLSRDIKACLFPVQRVLDHMQELALFMEAPEDLSR